MQFKNVRFHLRHTGDEHFRKPYFTRLTMIWGWNFTVGRWVLSARRPSDRARGFIDLKFGRTMLKTNRRMARV